MTFELSQPNRLVQLQPKDNPSSTVFPLDNPYGQEQPQFAFHLLTVNSQEKNDGKWSLREIMKYYLFLIEFKHLFKSKEMRKSQKVFSLMAKHIHSRKTSQCKSHHQKIQKSLGGIESIIKQYKSILSPLKEQWQQFYRTQKQVLINEYPNSGQHYYRMLRFKKCIKIYIEEQYIQSYQP